MSQIKGWSTETMQVRVAGDGVAHAPHTSFRPDVEGLRAVAVGLVVLDHLLGRPSGGFVGVDVFFVISGFLITGLLLKEHARTGRISFRNFYARRARRILPASLTMLLVTYLAARVLLAGDRLHQAGTDTLWSLGFLANVRFAAVGTDYFQAAQVHSPVQHYWSLAVEEQFYVGWPVLIVLVLALATRVVSRGGGPRLALGAVLVIGIGASFLFAVHQTSTSPTVAYFSTLARAWELGVGALVALCAPQLRKLPSAVRPVLGLVGLGGIVASALLIGAGTPFPGPGAGWPVLASALVIAAGTGARVSALMWPLTNPVSRYVGRVSYSLYLWHWPVLVLLEAVVPHSWAFDVIAVAVMSALTLASFHFIETPARAWHAWTRPRWNARAFTTRRVVAPLAAILACVIVAGAASALRPAPERAPRPAPVAVSSVGAASPGQQLATEIASALAAADWPPLTPKLADAAKDRPPEWALCTQVTAALQNKCTFGPDASGASKTPRSAVVLGDSIAVTWIPAIRAALGSQGYTVHGLTMMQCPAVTVSAREQVVKRPTFVQDCNRHRDETYGEIARIKPDLVILSSAENSLRRLDDGATGAAAEREWRAGTEKAVHDIRAAGARTVVLLSPPPSGLNVAYCATKFSGPQDCVSSIKTDWLTQSRAERAGARAAGGIYLDSHLWFCSRDGLCPAFVDRYLARLDSDHLTATWSRALGPQLASVLLPLG